MARLVVYFVLVICCGAMMLAPGQVNPGVMAIVMHGEADKLWDNDQLIETMQLKSTLTNYGTIEDGRLPVLEKNPMFFVRNTLKLIN
ncbi:hypothetical protein LOAG_18811 [Loa loa]|uniref:Uncharacterized protein n=1 Tax=Loa loa TaxID=7209 RepID=A0A1S0UFY9_LOALO|nr:hypothetical protein LOAG_18811 [Loa loa]EJD73787.1 hypothetical protein LOAG_18811 [Loa loa]